MDPEKELKFKPVGTHVVIKRDSDAPISEEDQNKPRRGTVVAVGPGRVEGGRWVRLQVQSGDRVVFRPYTTAEVELNGSKYVVMGEHQILSVLEDATQAEEGQEGDEAGDQRINVYTCPECKGFTTTIDVDEGVTPATLNCRASGKEGDCKGMAMSSMYPKGPRPAHIPAPAWEWYKPSKEEIAAMPEAHRSHYENEGLQIRKRK